MPSARWLAPLLLAAVAFRAVVVDCASTDGGDAPSEDQPSLHYELSNGVPIPLLGMGIGNLAHEQIPEVVSTQLGAGVLLVDTARASNNERILATAVARFDGSRRAGMDDEEEGRGNTRGGGSDAASNEHTFPPLQVVTKVWYTYLGYERTQLSIKEALEALAPAASLRHVHIHFLIHWPYCRDDIEWMHCEEEENNLPQRVKDAGPPPHLDKENAYKGSWKAFEEAYIEHQQMLKQSKGAEGTHQPTIASIGLSNFHVDEVRALMATRPRIPPHVFQGNAWAVFHDPFLMDYLEENGIFFQAYGLMNGILQRRNDAPGAYSVLTGLAHELTATAFSEGKKVKATEATVLLAFFLKKRIGVIPRAASATHQKENSPQSISAILPHLTESHMAKLATAIPALMKGEDLHASISFMNALKSPIQIHWLNPETKEEVLVSEIIHPGSVEVQKSHPGHRFVAYDPDRSIRREFEVKAEYGERQDFMVEL